MAPYYDYLIILSPSESIINHVKELKDFSNEVIGGYDSRHSKAHITVQPWPRKKPLWVDPLIPKLERDLQTLPPVVLDINGFNFFEQQDTTTIYARIDANRLTDVWFKQLRKYFNTFKFVPHITIARTIPNESFRKLWPHFKNKEWKEQFRVDKLTILRRETIGYDKIYKVYKEIPFNLNLNFYTFTNSKLKLPPLQLHREIKEQFSLF